MQATALGHGAPRVARSVGMSGSEVRNARPRASGETPKNQYLVICISSIFINCSYPFHLIGGQSKIPDACIFDDVLFVGAAGDCNIACLKVPADNDLGRGLAVGFCDCTDCRGVEKCLGVTAATEWEPAFLPLPHVPLPCRRQHHCVAESGEESSGQCSPDPAV